MKFSARTDRAQVHHSRGGRRFAIAEFVAPTAPEGTPRLRVDIAFVLDRSGSMAGQKFLLARKAIEQAIQTLCADDTFSVVIYDNQVEIVQPATTATRNAKSRAVSNLRKVSPRGTTNLSEGWLVGCGQVAEHLTASRIGRCLVLTDGLANVGITDPITLAHHATQLRSRGVSTSTFGVGADFDEVLLGQMADAGGGAFRFIEHPQQIPSLIANELGDTLEIVARNVAIDIHVEPEVQVRPIGPYPWIKTDTGIQVALPDLVSDQELEIPLEVRLAGGPVGETTAMRLTLTDRDSVLDAACQVVEWTWVQTLSDADVIDTGVQALVAERLAARARERASALNRDGQYHAARKHIEKALFHLENRFETSRSMRSLIAQLQRDADRLSHEMDAMDRKQMHSSATSIARGGTVTGIPRKRSSSTS